MKKCCKQNLPPTPFPLRFVNTFNAPQPSGCDEFGAHITITRDGSTFWASDMTKTSNNASITTVDPISVYATDIVEVTMEALPITDPACSSTNTTELEMDVGSVSAGLTTVRTVTSNDQPPTTTYQFSPVQGSLDLVNIYGDATYVTPSNAFTFTVKSTDYHPLPANCDKWKMEVTLNGTLVCEVVKDSSAVATVTNPSFQVTSTDVIEATVTAFAPTGSCSSQYSSTEVFMQTGYGNTNVNPYTTRLNFTSPGTQSYSFSPVENVDDTINIYGTPIV